MTDDELKKIADTIAEQMSYVSTDERGKLFLFISENLKNHTQYYTATLFKKIAEEYGYE